MKFRLAILAGLLACAPAWAQLSSPLPAGQGAGVHSPDSPFAPLPQRKDVIPWPLLTTIATKVEKNRVLPVFNKDQLALNEKPQRIQGFMMPLEPGDKQKHFLLSSVPTSCNFCVPAGPEGLIEIRSTVPVRYTLEPVVMEGLLAVLKDDPYGLFYRVVEAKLVN